MRPALWPRHMALWTPMWLAGGGGGVSGARGPGARAMASRVSHPRPREALSRPLALSFLRLLIVFVTVWQGRSEGQGYRPL